MAELTILETLQHALEHHQAGRLPEAEALYREILARDSQCADALNLLGVIADQVGKHGLAVELIGRAAALAPGTAAIHSNLGEAYRHLNRLDEAVASFQRALALQPGFPEALSNLGNALAAQGLLDNAIPCFRQALALRPNFANAWNNLGNVLRSQGHFDESTACYRQALALQPNFAEAHNNLGNAFREQGPLDEACACFQRALELKPRYPDALNNLGAVFNELGQLDDAIARYQQALILTPDRPDIHSNLILALHCCSGHEPSVIDAELRRWNQQHGHPLAKFIQRHDNDRDPDRPLRIGYVSPDLRSQPVGWFLLPLLSAHDHRAFKIYCYSGAPSPDDITTQLRSHSDGWRDLTGRTTAQIADLIREDRIDILVDLALHTAKNYLLVFAHKPAPVQATYLAYPGNSGLATIDYRITDRHLDPPAHAAVPGAEQPIRLPETYWCYQPIVHPPPEVTPLPATTAGYITFGCLNNFCKVTPATLAAWCRLLAAVPQSQLQLHLRPGAHQSRLRDWFASNDVDPRRLSFLDRVPHKQYLQSYQSIDIGLDPFPFPGGTTTCDALWMGVPVISLAGPTPVTRGGLSLLSNVGLSELVAHSVDEYVEKASTLAGDLPRLAALRASLRERMQRSPLMDAPRFARNIETAYRTMWHRWCAQPAPAAIPTR